MLCLCQRRKGFVLSLCEGIGVKSLGKSVWLTVSSKSAMRDVFDVLV